MKYVKDEENSLVLLCAGKAKHAERLGPLHFLAPPFVSRQKVEKQPMIKNVTAAWTFEKVR